MRTILRSDVRHDVHKAEHCQTGFDKSAEKGLLVGGSRSSLMWRSSQGLASSCLPEVDLFPE